MLSNPQTRSAINLRVKSFKVNKSTSTFDLITNEEEQATANDILMING